MRCHSAPQPCDSRQVNDGTEDQVEVSFPASPVFSRVGRVAVAGLAMRLGVDIADVERLRLAVDHAVAALHGKGRIKLSLHWEPQRLTITVGNPDELLDEVRSRRVRAALSSMVDEVSVGPSAIDLTLLDANAGPGISASNGSSSN